MLGEVERALGRGGGRGGEIWLDMELKPEACLQVGLRGGLLASHAVEVFDRRVERRLAALAL